MILSAFANAQSWKQYYDSTGAFWGRDWNKTVALLQRAEKTALQDLGIYDQNYVTIINDLGVAYWRMKDYRSAEKLLRQSLEIKKELYTEGDISEIQKTMTNLAGLYADQGNVTQSKSYYKKIVLLQPLEPALFFNAAQNLISLYESLHQVDSALMIWKSVDGRNLSIHDTADAATEWMITYARVQRKSKHYHLSRATIDSLQLLYSTTPGLNNATWSAKILNEAGMLNLETGFFGQAERDLLKAYHLVKRNVTADDLLIIDVLNNLARVYERLSIYDKALVYYDEALAYCIRTHGELTLPTVTLKNNIAGIYLKQGNTPGAIDLFEEVVGHYKMLVMETDPLFITALSNIANAYRRNNEGHNAYVHLRRAHELIERAHIEQTDLSATVLNNLAVVYTQKGDFKTAAAYYEKAYQIKSSLYGDESVMLLDIVSNLAMIYWVLNKPDLAIPLFNRSLIISKKEIRYIFPNLSEKEQTQFYQKIREDFERFNTVAIQWHEKHPQLIEIMFDNQMLIKSLKFFTRQRRQTLAQNDSVLYRQSETLKARRERLAYLYQLPLKEIVAQGTSLRSIEEEIEALEKVISLKTSMLVSENMVRDNISWKDLHQKLKEDEVMIEMIRFRKFYSAPAKNEPTLFSFGFTDSIYYSAVVITKEFQHHPMLIVLKEGINMETRFLSYYKNALTFAVQDENSYSSYWQPFEPALHGKKKVYFSADGVYHKLNLNTLWIAKEKKFILEQYDLHFLLNPSQMLETGRDAVSSRRHAILIGDPNFDTTVINGSQSTTGNEKIFPGLPGTAEEIVNIARILRDHRWGADVLLKNDASEKNLKRIQSPSILHLATHGFFSTDLVHLNDEAKQQYLFHSGLLLSGADKQVTDDAETISNDGVVTAFEVMNLNLTHTDLVVLSACETGLGKIENGEGVYGLQRSFLQAGASKVLITLWKVDDQHTKDLMIRFYRYLADGHYARAALKLAQLDKLSEDRNPLYWGGFVMAGAR